MVGVMKGDTRSSDDGSYGLPNPSYNRCQGSLYVE